MTDADVSEITVFLQAYRQQTAPIVIDDIRLEANNGTPTPEPINPPPVDTTPPDETPTDPAPPEELPPRVGNNLVRNADFSTGDLSGWQSSGPAGAATLSDGVLKLVATQDNTIRVEQMITGLQPETRYSFSVKLLSRRCVGIIWCRCRHSICEDEFCQGRRLARKTFHLLHGC